MPYAETHYRVLRDRQHRAIAGLSMGGAHTLNIAVPHAGRVCLRRRVQLRHHSGSFRLAGPVPLRRLVRPGNSSTLAELDNAAAKKDWKLFWFSTGKDDFLLATTKATVELFQKHGYHADVPRKRRRSHLDQLARVSERVRAAIVSIAT